MCGIAGLHIKQTGYFTSVQIEKIIDAMLLGIEHRGTDATGMFIAGVGGKQVQLSKEAIAASVYIHARPNVIVEEPRTILLHTRFATQGEPSNNANNHPVVCGTSFAVHNGHISNDSKLFESEQMDRIAEVDSEVIPALIAKYGLDNATACLELLDGGFAVGIVDPINNPDQLVMAKGRNSPFYFYENANFLMFASTLDTLKDAWGAAIGTPPANGKFYMLKEGQMLWQDGAEESTLDTFELKPYTWGYTSYSRFSSGTTGYTTRSGINTSEKCDCGHTRFWHNRPDYSGSCLARNGSDGPANVSGTLCDCLSYLPVVADTTPPTTTPIIYGSNPCDDCGELFAALHWVGYANYYVCESCLEDIESHPTTCDTNPGDRETDTTVPPPVVRVTRNNLDTQETLDAMDWDALAQSRTRHEYLLAKATQGTKHSKDFVTWLMFSASPAALESQDWLRELKQEVEDAYAAAHQELLAWEDELGLEGSFFEEDEVVTFDQNEAGQLSLVGS